MYFRPDTGGLTLVALEDDSRVGESAEAELDYVAKGFVDRAIERICRRVPAMEEGSYHSSHTGRDSLTPDQRAIIGKTDLEGYYLATGFSGTGFKLAPAVGQCVSELVLNGKATTVDISAFTPKRFERGEYLKGENDYGYLWRNVSS
jgi:sarcosine oxidase subunit beta